MRIRRSPLLLAVALPILLVVARGQRVVSFGVDPAQISPVGAVATATPTPPSLIPVAPAPAILPVNVISASGVTAQPLSTGETSISLDVANGIRAVPPSRVSVPVGETLRITGPNSAGRPVQWTKDGRTLAGATANPLVISSVLAGDAGTYVMTVAAAPSAPAAASQALVLGVGPAPRLFGLANRGTLAAGPGEIVTAGFVVGGTSASESKKIIIRAVGPGLRALGIANPLRAPVLRIFDGAGKPYNNGYVYLSVVGALTYETDLAASLAKVGAFPLPANSLDAVLMLPFPPGAYTAQVSSGDNTAGEVLIEIYEVP